MFKPVGVSVKGVVAIEVVCVCDLWVSCVGVTELMLCDSGCVCCAW